MLSYQCWPCVGMRIYRNMHLEFTFPTLTSMDDIYILGGGRDSELQHHLIIKKCC